MLPVCGELQSLSSTAYLETYMKKYCVMALVLLCILLELWSSERAFSYFLRGENQKLFCLG